MSGETLATWIIAAATLLGAVVAIYHKASADADKIVSAMNAVRGTAHRTLRRDERELRGPREAHP